MATWTNMFSWTLLLPLVAAAYAVYCVILYRRNKANVQQLPGPRYLWTLFSMANSVLPNSEWNGGMLLSWIGRHSMWDKYGSEILAFVPIIPGQPIMWTRSVEVARQLLANKSDWDKAPESVESLGMFGENLFSSYRDRWARHRRIVAPGFNQKLYELVWRESLRTYYDMVQTEEWLNHGGSYVHPDVIAMTSKIALYLIASCGFGMSLAWDGNVGERIRGLSLPECFQITSDSMIAQIFLPKWAFRLPFKALRKVYESNLVIESILMRIIEKRRLAGADPVQQGNAKDVFNLLLTANEAETDSKNALTDRELISNCFLLMLAGHETTSHGLGAALGLLACNPDIQEKAYEEVMTVVPDGSDPTFQDLESLVYVQASFMEAMRLFPSVNGIPRRAVQDTVLKVPTKQGSAYDLPIKKGQIIVVDFIGLNYNERHYSHPDEYTPGRWLDPTVEQGMNFSTGPRVCVGRKFAMVEGTTILAMLIRDWKITPILYEGETLPEWRVRCMDNAVAAAIGFGPTAFPLRFTKREKALIAA
ncbi:cytochrome P450 [Calocera viscosa TUFC12733]|uniref:Cytochrome P450 n=1 Tax=Calocera viscosa (strain TUFC12733) TaxID=1330018 RepID=A0A167JHX6_CALVF|nr:cytochrome P450 [Calocera viscosa TUFC12733]